MLLPHKTLIVLADGEQFELYRNAGNEAEPRLETVETPKLDPHNKGAGAHHYSSAGNPSGSLLDEDAHAAAISAWLNHEVLTHKIEHLVVIAAPRTLGEMRLHYHKELEHKLLGELSKDLTGRPAEDIVEALRAV